MSKAKRMIYVRDENVEFYDGLENKSDFVNECLKTARLGGVDNIKVEEVAETNSSETAQTRDVKSDLEKMRERDAARLAQYRKENGLYDPVNNPRE